MKIQNSLLLATALAFAGGGYELEGGFWSGIEDLSSLDYARQGASLIFSWRGAGIMLQQADSTAGSWQDISPGTTSDGANYQLRR